MATLIVKNFHVEDLNLGIPSVKNGTTFISSGERALIDNITPDVTIPGTPLTIDNLSISSLASLGLSYIKIIRENTNIYVQNTVFIPDVIRIKKIEGLSPLNNSLIYAFGNSNNTFATSVVWTVAIPNTNAFPNGSYIDIYFPDLTLYPNMYLMLALVKNSWSSRTIVNETNKLCSIPADSIYYTINPNYSLEDIGLPHTIACQGYNSYNGTLNRCILAFEDLSFEDPECMRDYAQLTISVSSAFFDDQHISETRLGETIVCMLEGSKVLTPLGYINVEDLKIGDLIIRGNGKMPAYIKDLKKNIYPSLPEYNPYIVEKNFFGMNHPSDNVYLSRRHLICDKSVENISHLNVFPEDTMKNLKSLGCKQVNLNKILVYYHIQLENPWDTLIVENLIIESWVK